jgi:hypothetical protein
MHESAALRIAAATDLHILTEDQSMSPMVVSHSLLARRPNINGNVTIAREQ